MEACLDIQYDRTVLITDEIGALNNKVHVYNIPFLSQTGQNRPLCYFTLSIKRPTILLINEESLGGKGLIKCFRCYDSCTRDAQCSFETLEKNLVCFVHDS